MKQTKKFIELREKVRKFVSFIRLFGRADSTGTRRALSTNIYSKLSGHDLNGDRNADLTPEQVQEFKSKMICLKDDIRDLLNEMDR